MIRARIVCGGLVALLSGTASAQQFDPVQANQLADQVIADALKLKAAIAAAIPPTPTPPPAAVIRVPVGGNLQAAVDAASAGATILVAPGTYNGLTLRQKPPGAAITIKADSQALPAAGTRVSPALAFALVRVTSPDGLSPIRTERGASGYILDGFAPQFVGDGTVAFIAIGDPAEVDPTKAPDGIVLAHLLIVGNTSRGGKRGIAANSRGLVVRDSYLAGLFFSADSQGVGGWNGPGPVLLENNYMEASGENVLFGGGDPTNAFMQPQHITVRGNTLTKPLAWRGKAGVTIKNGLEMKNALHVLIENNLIENTWTNGQVGALVLMTPRNQDGTAPYSGIADVTIQNNVIRHGGAFLQILGSDDSQPSIRLVGLKILNNLVYDIDPQAWRDPVTGDWGSGRIFQITRGPAAIEIAHNTILGTNLNAAFSFGDVGDPKIDGLNVHDNVLPEGEYGMAGANTGLGATAWSTYVVNGVFERNLIALGTSGRTITYPGATNYKSAAAEAVIGPDFKLLAKFAGLTSTDGKPIGADIDELRKRVSF